MTKNKTPQDNTVDEPVRRIVIDEYLDVLEMKMKPVSDKFLDRLADDLIQYAQKPTTYKISQFYTSRGFNGSSLERWRKRNVKLDAAYLHAKQVIGDRREIGALKHKLNHAVVLPSMTHYDQEWRKDTKWKSKLKQKEHVENAPVKVIIEQFPPSNLVPDKKPESSE